MILHEHLTFFYKDASRFDTIREYLKEKHKLVAPSIANEERLKRQVVWEDENGIGRFRVNFDFNPRKVIECKFICKPTIKIPLSAPYIYPKILFRYWSQRLNEEMIEEDPMQEVYLDIYKNWKPISIVDMVEEFKRTGLKINLDVLIK